jgi:hypothetical protein
MEVMVVWVSMLMLMLMLSFNVNFNVHNCAQPAANRGGEGKGRAS